MWQMLQNVILHNCAQWCILGQLQEFVKTNALPQKNILAFSSLPKATSVLVCANPSRPSALQQEKLCTERTPGTSPGTRPTPAAGGAREALVLAGLAGADALDHALPPHAPQDARRAKAIKHLPSMCGASRVVLQTYSITPSSCFLVQTFALPSQSAELAFRTRP